MYTIVIGDKAYSSWSMRGWLMLAAFGLPFEERLVRMYDPEFDAMQAAHAPARTVPQLEWRDGGRIRRVWETSAIAEVLAERHPDAGLWPQDPWARTVARVVSAEMHASFTGLRAACPVNLHRVGERSLRHGPEVDADLDRLAAVWTWALAETGGPWLGGAAFSVADVMYAPVATRLESYGLMRPDLADYAARLLAHGPVADWIRQGRADPRRIARYTDGI